MPQFDTENPDTDYKNGALGYLDLLVMKKFKNGFGVGPVCGWIQPYGADGRFCFLRPSYSNPLGGRYEKFYSGCFPIGSYYECK